MIDQKKHVLLVDDEEKLLASMGRRLLVLGFEPHTAASGMKAIEIARQNPVDLAIVDLQMPDMDGLVTITKLKEIQPGLKTILLTGHGNEKIKQATESLNSLYFEKDEMGDFWQFIKKLNNDGKVVVIRPASSRAVTGESSGLPSENEIEIHPHAGYLESNYQKRGEEKISSDSVSPPRIVGETRAMQKLRRDIERVALLDCTVALYGETGTGKKLAARAIHAGSMRRSQRFLSINCADFDSEHPAGYLLGYKTGNLYEAIRSRSGIFGAGRVGTLFFDRIEKMPGKMQDQLLKIIDMNEQDNHSTNIRIFVASTEPLSHQKNVGSFNKTLFERLKIFELNIPPLKERKDDIPPLSQYFLDKYRQELDKKVYSIAPEVHMILAGYTFPGNVHELEYIIERAVILANGNTIERDHLPVRFLEEATPETPGKIKQFCTLAELEKRYIVEVLESCNANKSKTAKILSISRAALWRKLKQIKAEQADS